ncbi:MAG: DUF5606 domain-containing protein [Flavobacteriaceae bacterium]|nr:DUF5606 domain-containing protein [Flavobacteriaceae bacterium]
MDIDKILAIGGKPGLYELKAQTRGGFVAQSLKDGKKISVSIRHQVSLLSEIAVYTLTQELPLREVFQKIKEKENGQKTAISHKAPKIELEEFFFEVLPDYDEDRVYASDIKKIVQWYNLLIDYGLTNFVAEEETTEGQEAPEVQDTTQEEEA